MWGPDSTSTGDPGTCSRRALYWSVGPSLAVLGERSWQMVQESLSGSEQPFCGHFRKRFPVLLDLAIQGTPFSLSAPSHQLVWLFSMSQAFGMRESGRCPSIHPHLVPCF